MTFRAKWTYDRELLRHEKILGTCTCNHDRLDHGVGRVSTVLSVQTGTYASNNRRFGGSSRRAGRVNPPQLLRIAVSGVQRHPPPPLPPPPLLPRSGHPTARIVV